MMSRLLIRDIHNPRVYDAWNHEDESLEVIDISKEIAHLPGGDPRIDLEDGLVVFMQEAWRCLKPGGSLTIHVPVASHPDAVADPLARRFFNEGTFLHFGKPVDVDDWKWDRYGKDHGTRFNIVHTSCGGGILNCMMEKPDD